MDEGEEIPSFYLDHDVGFVGSGSDVGSGFNDGSGNEGGGLQAPPPPPPPDFPSGFNSGVGGGSDDGGGTPAIPDLEFGNEIIPKRKRGRPRKPPTPAVVTLGPKRPRGRPRKSPIPAVETPVPTAWTPQNTNEQKQNFVREHSDLSKLKPPSRLGGFRTGEQLHDLLKKASLALVSGIKVAADANEMIELSSNTFNYLDFLGVDYTPVHIAVCSVIRLQCQKEALAKQKPHSAFDTKALHDEAALEFSQAEGRRAEVNMELEDAQREFDVIMAHVKRLSEELKNANEKSAKLEAIFAAAQADKVSCDEAYSKTKSKLELIAPKMSDAQKAIDEFEKQWKETMDGLDRAMEETFNIRI